MVEAKDSIPRLSHQGLRVLKVFIENPYRRYCGADLMKITGLRSGTLYPILFRFEKDDYLESEWEDGDPKVLARPRKRLYTITSSGLQLAKDVFSEFAPLAVSLGSIS